jgi:transposase InsO family protein
MRELGLRSKARKEKRKSVNGNKVTSAGNIYENLLKRDFSTSKISEKWVTDVTEYEHTITPSMSRKANALDNACAESFFSFLKSERKILKKIKNIEEAKQIIHEYIHYYNHERIQGVLDYKTPKQYSMAC